MKLRPILAGLLCVLLLAQTPPAFGYSVLTHEEIVDMLWDTDIRPLLHQKFPHATAEELKAAHAYAYGGSVIQDLGYYPFGSHEFSDLVHYVRSGDFVEALLRNAQTLEEYAFALGALAHYAADVKGHPAVNRAVAIEYPDLAAKYHESSITYAQDQTAHIRTEFGFDMVQVAKGRYTAQQYHDYIGFEVAKPLLERTFQQVYGVPLTDILTHEDLAIGSYRHAVSGWIPKLTKAAIHDRRAQLAKEIPNFSEKQFLYNVSRADYEREWGYEYQRPGIGTRILGFFLKLIPKVGPFKAVAFKAPTPQTEDMFFKSANDTIAYYREALKALAAENLKLANRDFDTGKVTKAGEYPLTDKSYAKLLDRLDNAHFQQATPALQQNILAFYDGSSTIGAGLKECDRKKLAKNLDDLRSVNGVAEAQPATTK